MSVTQRDDEGFLERWVQAGNAFYVGRVERDPVNGRLYFEIIADPYEGEVVRTLTFTGVRDFKEKWFEEPDPRLIEQIIGMHCYPQKRGGCYLIHMDQSEMTFFTEAEPIVMEVQPSADQPRAARGASGASSRL